MGSTQHQSTDTYQIRSYGPHDRARFLSLYETVWGRRKSEEWFDWRFRANPYRDEIQMTVVESDGKLVGAEPLLPYRLRIDGDVHTADQPVDWIVHPEHRRCGLFTRMTEDVLDRYLPNVSLFFNFPNELLRPGLEKFDWQTVGPVVCRYRLQNTRQFVEEAEAQQLPAAALVAGRLGEPIVSAGLSLLDRLNSPPDEISIERVDGVPIETVHDLYRSTRPETIHIVRDRPFLQWRFANPNWETTSYIASRDGKTVASLITATEQIDDCRITHLLDIQPMSRQRRRPAAFEALLANVLDDSCESDLLRAPGGYYPQLFRRYGFYRDDTFPLSVAATQTTHAIRTPDASDASSLHSASTELADSAAWCLTVADLDIE